MSADVVPRLAPKEPGLECAFGCGWRPSSGSVLGRSRGLRRHERNCRLRPGGPVDDLKLPAVAP